VTTSGRITRLGHVEGTPDKKEHKTFVGYLEEAKKGAGVFFPLTQGWAFIA
jgi:hypothetical protein